MKVHKITSLKKNVLLVDGLPKESFDHFIEDGSLRYDEDKWLEGRSHAWYCNDAKLKGNWNLLGKLKDLSDSDCEPLVEKSFGLYADYKKGVRFLGGKYYEFDTPKESFLSALEADEVLFKNPVARTIPYVREIDIALETDLYEKRIQWREAEKNLFSPETLVFVEQ